MERIDGPVLALAVTTVNDDATTSDGLLELRHANLADRDTRRNTHDRCSDQVLWRDTETDVCGQHGTGDRRETYAGQGRQTGTEETIGAGRTRSHGEVELRLGHVVDVGTDETRRLALADEGGRRSDDGLSTGDVHDLEEEPRAANTTISSRRLLIEQRGTYKLLMSHCMTPR